MVSWEIDFLIKSINNNEGIPATDMPSLLLRKIVVKFNCVVDFVGIGMPLHHTTDQLKRAKGVETEAAIFTNDIGVLARNGFSDGIGIALLFRTVGINEEVKKQINNYFGAFIAIFIPNDLLFSTL